VKEPGDLAHPFPFWRTTWGLERVPGIDKGRRHAGFKNLEKRSLLGAPAEPGSGRKRIRPEGPHVAGSARQIRSSESEAARGFDRHRRVQGVREYRLSASQSGLHSVGRRDANRAQQRCLAAVQGHAFYANTDLPARTTAQARTATPE